MSIVALEGLDIYVKKALKTIRIPQTRKTLLTAEVEAIVEDN
jgi:hypothetical protein